MKIIKRIDKMIIKRIEHVSIGDCLYPTHVQYEIIFNNKFYEWLKWYNVNAAATAGICINTWPVKKMNDYDRIIEAIDRTIHCSWEFTKNNPWRDRIKLFFCKKIE